MNITRTRRNITLQQNVCVVYRFRFTTAYKENLLRRKPLSVENLRIFISLKKGKTKSKFPANIGFACNKIFITATAPRDTMKLISVLQKKKKSVNTFLGLCTVAAHIRNARTLQASDNLYVFMKAVYAAAIPTQIYSYSNTSLSERFHLWKPQNLCNGTKYTLIKFCNSLHKEQNYSACAYILASTITPFCLQFPLRVL